MLRTITMHVRFRQTDGQTGPHSLPSMWPVLVEFRSASSEGSTVEKVIESKNVM